MLFATRNVFLKHLFLYIQVLIRNISLLITSAFYILIHRIIKDLLWSLFLLFLIYLVNRNQASLILKRLFLWDCKQLKFYHLYGKYIIQLVLFIIWEWKKCFLLLEQRTIMNFHIEIWHPCNNSHYIQPILLYYHIFIFEILSPYFHQIP